MQDIQLTKTIKCVVVGDDDVGKSSLIAFLTGQETPPQTYAENCGGYYSFLEPTTLKEPIKLKHKYYNLTLWDSISDEGYEPRGLLSYPFADIILVCFSIDSPTSLANVREKWLPDILHYAQGLPFIIVGLQTDLRDDVVLLKKYALEGTKMVMKREGEEVAKKYSSKYVEGTVFERSDLDYLPEKVVRAVVNQPKPRLCTKPGCMIL